MRTLTLDIDSAIVATFPNIMVGGFVVQGIDRAVSRLADTIGIEIDAARAALYDQGLNLQNLVEDPRIAGWRAAFKEMGLKPSTFKSSVEALARRLLKVESINTPLPAVNLYCAISAKQLAPMGAYDLDRLPEDRITLRFADPQADRFTPLTGRPEDMQLSPRIAVYACGRQVICWAFNYRDSKDSSLQHETRLAVFFSEGITVDHRAVLARALNELRTIFSANGANVGAVFYADEKNPQATVNL